MAAIFQPFKPIKYLKSSIFKQKYVFNNKSASFEQHFLLKNEFFFRKKRYFHTKWLKMTIFCLFELKKQTINHWDA